MPTPSFRERTEAIELHDAPEAAEADPHAALRGLSYEDAAALLSPHSAASPSPSGAQGAGAEAGAADDHPDFADKLAKWSRTAPKQSYDRVRFRGVLVNKRTRQLVRRAEGIMREHFDHEDFRFDFSQGSYNRSVSASAGTHDGGGALDIRTRGHRKKVVDHMVQSLRMAGFAAWSRGRGHDSFGGSPHLHAIAIGDRELASIARGQVTDFARGRNGLRGHARDPDRDLKAPVPKWAKRKLNRLK